MFVYAALVADTSCVGKTPSSSPAAPGSTPPGASSGAPPPATSAAPTTTAPAAPTSKPATSSGSGAARYDITYLFEHRAYMSLCSANKSPSSAPSSTSKNSAPTQMAHVGAAGVVGAAVLALIA